MKNKWVGGILSVFLFACLFAAGRWTATFVVAWREKSVDNIDVCAGVLMFLAFVIILLIFSIYVCCFYKNKTSLSICIQQPGFKEDKVEDGKVAFSAQQLLDELQKFKDQGYNLENQIYFVDKSNNHISLKNVGLTHISGKDDWVEVF